MTRHNMGYLVVRSFAKRTGLHFKDDKHFQSFVAKGLVEGTAVHLLLPTTYMNASGRAIRSYLDFLKLDPSRLVVVVDDIALPFGDLRVRASGSTGGHNGLKSVQESLGTAHYMRLRMGIGSSVGRDLAEYVLAPFNKEELEHLDVFIDRGVGVLQRLLKEGIPNTIDLRKGV
jgi:PTH1 family peptidyl-tRNA hydrolase